MRISDWSSDVCSSDLWPSCRAILPAKRARKPFVIGPLTAPSAMTSLSEPYWILAYPEGEFVCVTERKCTSPAVEVLPNTLPFGPRKTTMRSTTNNVPSIDGSATLKTFAEATTTERTLSHVERSTHRTPRTTKDHKK